MPYTAEISRANPACFLFLVIQCMGMGQQIAGQPGPTKGEVSADAVNRIVDALSQRCSSGMDVRDYFHVGILGFSSEGFIFNRNKLVNTSALAGTTPERPFLPISQVVEVAEIEERLVKENYGGGEIVEVTRRMPVWLRNRLGNWDPMCAMLRLMEQPLAEWIGSAPRLVPAHRHHHLRWLVHGRGSTGRGRTHQEHANPPSNDGNVLLFTVHLSTAKEAQPRHFPSQEQGLPSLGEGVEDSKMMFRMTSVLPEPSRQQAASMGFEVDELARGFVLNADAVSLAQFLDIGTRGPSNLH